jgi:CNT family concentrative nucleoside transporter
MSAPAAVLISKVMVPEAGEPLTGGEMKIKVPRPYANTLDAAAGGALDGLKLAAGIGAVLLVFISFIYGFDFFLNKLNTSFEKIAGYAFSPFALAMGVPAEECLAVGKLLGIKVVFNEFISYLQLRDMVACGLLSERAVVISTYALCSFANFGSIAILIGGIGSIAPSRRQEVAALGFRALAAGAVAGFMTATVVGVLL